MDKPSRTAPVYKTLDLLPQERVVEEVPCSSYDGLAFIAGKLILTTERLLWTPYSRYLLVEPVRIAKTDLMAVEPHKERTLSNILFTSRWTVESRTGQTALFSFGFMTGRQTKDWIIKVRQWANIP